MEDCNLETYIKKYIGSFRLMIFETSETFGNKSRNKAPQSYDIFQRLNHQQSMASMKRTDGLQLTWAYTYKGNLVTMLWIHVCLELHTPKTYWVILDWT
jgi:hypothetical protein